MTDSGKRSRGRAFEMLDAMRAAAMPSADSDAGLDRLVHIAADAAFLAHTGRPLDEAEAEVVERDGQGYLRDLWEGWMRAGLSAVIDDLIRITPTGSGDTP